MLNFSCTAVLMSALLVVNAAGYGQTQSNAYQQNSAANYYVTIPQAGQPSTTGYSNPAAESAGQPVQPARRQGSSQKKSATTKSASSVQQVSNNPAQQQAQQLSAANYYVAPANYYTNNAQGSPQAVSTSAQTAYNQQVTHQTITPPAYVASASAKDKGLLNRLLHREPSNNPNRTGAVKQVTNLAGRAGRSVSYRASKLAGSMQQGMASWYGKDWHGKKTANGERYDMDSMTAAHKTLPFGTMVKVKNERNGRECMVRINNRGPFSKGRVLDLSRAAARQLDMMGAGVAKIKMEVVGRS